MLENAGPRQIGEPADSLSLPQPKGAEVFGGFLSAGNFLSCVIILHYFILPRRVIVVSHYASLCISLCLIMFPFIYHVPSCNIYNNTLPTVARDPLTVELTMLRLLDHDARGATGEEDLEVEMKVAQERLVFSSVAAVVPEVDAPLPAFLHNNGNAQEFYSTL